jgi:hypothetical protein
MAAQICSEFASHISAESFQVMWTAATKDSPHDCFFVDFEAPPATRYRINLDRAFVLPIDESQTPVTKELPIKTA